MDGRNPASVENGGSSYYSNRFFLASFWWCIGFRNHPQYGNFSEHQTDAFSVQEGLKPAKEQSVENLPEAAGVVATGDMKGDI